MPKEKLPCKFDEIKCDDLNGAYNEIAELLGVEAAVKLHDTFRGQQLTFPVHLFRKDFIARQIIEAYDGSNIKQLATRFGYSEKWIREIVKDNADNTDKK